MFHHSPEFYKIYELQTKCREILAEVELTKEKLELIIHKLEKAKEEYK